MAKEKPEKVIRIKENGSYVVCGNIPMAKQTIITDEGGVSVRWEKGKEYPRMEQYSLCRCGKSKSAPYCDGSHRETNFDGTETASRKPYLEQAEKMEGPELTLTDAPELCATARFCHQGKSTWDDTLNPTGKDSKKIAIKSSQECPAGRLVEWDKKTGKPLEPELIKSIGIVEDPAEGVSGPIWAMGGIPVESTDGKKYEVRNRVTLCRCGRSSNKPFCDGTHIDIGFRDTSSSHLSDKENKDSA